MAQAANDGIKLVRREHERFAVEVAAEVSSGLGVSGAVTRDLSRGGVCFIVPAPLERGAPFQIAISLVLSENVYSEPLVLKGQVIWCTETPEGFQIGASFLALTREAREYLQMFLSFLAEGVQMPESDGLAQEDDTDWEGEETDERGLFG